MSKWSVSASGLTDVGQRRERNEDAFFVDDGLQLYIVADGMGGHVGGGLASRMAVSTISAVIRQLGADPDATVEEGEIPLQGRDSASILRYAIQCASRAIYLRSLQETALRGMGTTAVVLWLHEGKAYLGNVGDSRGYLIRRQRMTQLTVDHSLVGEQMRAGILTERDARGHRLKNIITRSVGFQELVDVDINERTLKAGDRFLLCSDGLTNMLPDDRLLATVSDRASRDAARELIRLANEAGGEDNITLILVQIAAAGGGTESDDDAGWEEQTVQL